MSIPDFQTLMLPVLKQLEGGSAHTPREIRDVIAADFKLTAEDLAQLLPSGRQGAFANRVAWALGYLKQAVLVESPQRGTYLITDRGRQVLARRPTRIDIRYLQQFDEIRAFRGDSPNQTNITDPGDSGATSVLTPDEQIRIGYERSRENVVALLLERLRGVSPGFFEQAVVDLLVAMGYGGSVEDAGAVVGRAGDEGVDGVIKGDRLGLDAIFVQAKRWSGSVGRPEIQRFAGALQGKKARKGVFITTSSFTDEATDYVATLDTKIVLIDGKRLAELMVEFDVGVTKVRTFALWKLDEDYFIDE